MTTVKRFSFALALCLFALLVNTQAQTPRLDGVNLTPTEGRVRASAIGEVFDLRLEVVDESGDTVFSAAQPESGKPLDWNMTDSKGKRVTPGTYTVTVSYTTQAGKARKRIEQVLVTEEVTGGGIIATAGAQKSPQTYQASASASAPVGGPTAPVDGTGVANKIPKFVDADTLTSSNIREVGGRVGIGTLADPAAGLRLEINGATRITPGGSGGFMQFGNPNSETGLTWSRTASPAARADIRFNGTSLTLAALAGAGVPPNTYGVAITTGGRVGIGVTNPGIAKLQVNGGGGWGIYAEGTKGVYGVSTVPGGIGVYASASQGNNNDAALYATTTINAGNNTYFGHAGYFNGNVHVAGTLTVNQGCTGCTTAVSDRALKANISAIEPRSILDRLAAIPIRAWSYTSDDPAVRHVGPMAQDFRAAFNLGADDKHIDLIDANGVTMASIQALYQMMMEKDKQVQQMMRQKDGQIQQLQAQLNQVRRAARRRAARR